MKSVFSWTSAVVLATTFCAGVAHADQLADVKAKGTLVCGVMTNLEPFAYTDSKTQEQIGYDIDFCKSVAKHLGVKPELKVISFDARIPELNQGRVDILAAVLGYTAARATQIEFSDSYFVSTQKMGVRTGGPYKVLTDLDGKRLGAVKSSSTMNFLAKELPNAKVISYDDAPAAIMALVQGKVEGFGQSETLLRRLISKVGGAEKITVISPPMGTEAWGLGLRKNEPAFAAAVNQALASMEKSGEAKQIFDRWLGKSTDYQMEREFTIAPIPR